MFIFSNITILYTYLQVTMKPQLVLSVLALTLAIGHCRGPWNLSDPVMQIANNRVSVTLEGQ